MPSESYLVNVRQATPSQMQEAAREANLHQSPNQVFGLYRAIFTAIPSPMQIQVLAKGLKAAGFNYLRIATCARVATEADLAPEVLREAVQNMAAFAKARYESAKVSDLRSVAGEVYLDVDYGAKTIASDAISETYRFRHQGFTVISRGSLLTKRVRIGRKVYFASVTRRGNTLRLSAQKDPA